LSLQPVLGLGTHRLHGWQVRRDSAFLLQQADRAKDEKHPAKEIEYLNKGQQDLEEARKLARTDPAVFLEAADLAGALAHFEGARRDAEQGLALDPRRERLYRFLARLELRLGQHAQAEACWRRGLKAMPEQSDLLYSLAETLIQDGKVSEAQELLPRLRSRGVDPAPLAILEARLHMHHEQWIKASRTLESAQPRLARDPELARQAAWLLGQCYEQVGDADQQYAAYRRAGCDDPSSPSWVGVCAGMGRALVAMNKIDDALELFRRILPRAPEARLVVVWLLIAQNLGRPRAQRRWDEVDQLLEIAVRSEPRAVEAPRARPGPGGPGQIRAGREVTARGPGGTAPSG
jgi:tetratricopeptide (TPR) repeat protein